MSRRYRRNSSLLPQPGAFTDEMLRVFEQFYAEPVGTALPSPVFPRPGISGDAYAGLPDNADDETFSMTYVWPPRDEVWPRDDDHPDGVWLVYWTAMYPAGGASNTARNIWQRSIGSSEPTYRGDGLGGLPAAPAYLFRGTEEDAAEFVAKLREASLVWMKDEAEMVSITVLRTRCYEFGREKHYYVEVHEDDGDGVSAYDGDVRSFRDCLFGLWWVRAEEEHGDEPHSVDGPYSSESEADRAAERLAGRLDGRKYNERGFSASEVMSARERRGPSRESISRQSTVSGVCAIVYQVKKKQLLTVRVPGIHSKSVALEHGEDEVGDGYLDSQTVGPCGRTHTPSGVTAPGTGNGLALYTALATLAYQGYGLDCIGSCPSSAEYGSRSDEADAWWDSQVRRGLASKFKGRSGCASIEFGDLIDNGLVFWLEEPGDYEGKLRKAQEKYAAAFAAAAPSQDETTLDIIESELEQIPPRPAPPQAGVRHAGA